MDPALTSSREVSAHGCRRAARSTRAGSAIALCALQALTLLFVLAFVGRQATARVFAFGATASSVSASADLVVDGWSAQLHDQGGPVLLEDGRSTIEVEEDDDDDESCGVSFALRPPLDAGVVATSPVSPRRVRATETPLLGQARRRPGLPRGPPRA